MVENGATIGYRLTECDVCGELAYVQDARAFFLDPSEPGQPGMAGHAEDIRCPSCGRRTQIVGKVID
jgi:hypothetical protein